MAIKPFEQVFPGQNNPNLQPKKGKQIDPAEWERRQRMKEYRIAARREKRNRKSDEKKQRQLNATILRRMTRNTSKYNKNAGRNRLRAIEEERRKIRANAIQMAQRLAAVYDPSGAMFNVKPVTTLEDGRVVSLEAVERRKQRLAEKAKQQMLKEQGAHDEPVKRQAQREAVQIGEVGMNPDRFHMLQGDMASTNTKQQSGPNKQPKKENQEQQARQPPAKPIIPDGIDPPSDEEENWLELWSLPDEELDRRVQRAKKRATRARKELRVKQKSGKAERRAARDEKRRVYREIKQSWKVLREEERKRRKYLLAMEDEERKKLAVEVTNARRKEAMRVCEELGFTLENVEGVADIKPKALGMKGKEVPFDKLEVIGDKPSGLLINEEKREKPKGRRVDLGAIADEEYAYEVYGGEGEHDSMNANFVQLGSGTPGHDHEALNYNHRLRRKLKRAIDGAQVAKELLVRQAAIKHCEEQSIEVPEILRTPAKPQNIAGQRTLPDGTLESAKQERVRARVELAEFNAMAKVLRRQAKEMSIEAGIRIYLELMGRIPKRAGFEEFIEEREREKQRVAGVKVDEQPNGDIPMGGIWPAQSSQSMADLLASFPMPEDGNPEGVGDGETLVYNEALDGEAADEDSSEDSAAKQLKAEMNAGGIGASNGKLSSPVASEDDGNSDSDDSDSDAS